jgi:two-component system, OmpR family, response regulator RegX3
MTRFGYGLGNYSAFIDLDRENPFLISLRVGFFMVTSVNLEGVRMLPASSSLAILAFASNAALGQNIDLSGLHPVTVRWMLDLSEMIYEVGIVNPLSMIVAGDGDNLSSIRACYALRQASSVPLHLISSTMSETEAELACSLGATTVNGAGSAPAVIAQFIWQFLKLSAEALETAEPLETDSAKHLEIAGLKMDLGRRTACIDGAGVTLTRIEFELLTVLVRSPGSVISRAELIAKVWGSDWFGAENVLDTHLTHLRRKISRSRLDKAIVNVRGVGFYFEPMYQCRAESVP